MASTTKTDQALVQGDTLTLQLTLKNGGTPIDVSEWTFIGQVREDPDDTEALADMTFDTTDAENGVVTAKVAAEETEGFPTPFVHYHIRATTDADEKVTILIGRILMTKDSARE